MSSTKSWCKVASNLDSHPKIRRAGRNGREVFLFALRRNAEPGNPVPGRLPLEMLEPWYLADQLMMSETEAVTGVTAAVTAGLIAQDGDQWVILGWDEDWGKASSSGAERTAKWREKNKAVTPVTTRDKRDVTKRHGDGGDAREEIRSEEKRGEERRVEKKLRAVPDAPKSDHQRVVAHFHQRYLSAYSQAPSWKGPPAKLISDLVKANGADEVIVRIDRLFDGHGPPWVKPPFTVTTLSSQWNALIPTLRADPLMQLALGGES